MNASFELAQVNIGRLLAPIDSPEIAEFVAALESINRLADGSPGFLWRLTTPDGNATAIRPFDDDMILVNMSVWDSLESLRAFTYTSAHVGVLRRRREWFERMITAHLALWWVRAGHRPTLTEARDRLERLRRDGPTPAAFTFRTPFEPDSSEPGSPLVDAEFCWPDQAAS
jgi:heme-degrading monooxygenase HmoA